MRSRPGAFCASVNLRGFAAALALVLAAVQAPASALRCQAECGRDAVRATASHPACHGEGRAADPAPSGHSCRGHLAPCVLSGAPAVPAFSTAFGAAWDLAAPPSFAAVPSGSPGALALPFLRSFESPSPTALPSVLRL